VIVREQHVEDVEMCNRARDRLSRGQERASSRDRIRKKYDDLTFEPLGQPIAFVTLDGAPDG
jgi:hypothetical protein